MQDYGAKKIYLFGSVLWKKNPNDVDVAVAGVSEDRCVSLTLELEGMWVACGFVFHWTYCSPIT